MQNAREILKKAQIRPSSQRVAILDYLIKHREHPSADEIYSGLSPQLPFLSRTTVYNTLNLLVEHMSVMALTIDDTCLRFDADMHPHSHFLCRKCKRIYDLSLPEVDSACIEENFKVEEFQVYMKGICKKCSRRY